MGLMAGAARPAMMGAGGAAAAFAAGRRGDPHRHELEEAMAQVDKVVGMSAEGTKALGKDIVDLSLDIPLASKEIATLIKAGSGAGGIDKALPDGKERKRLSAFARASGQMSQAFEMSATEGGAYFADWQDKLGLTFDAAVPSGDAANQLSNEVNARASEIVNVAGRVGTIAQMGGSARRDRCPLGRLRLRRTVAGDHGERLRGVLPAR